MFAVIKTALERWKMKRTMRKYMTAEAVALAVRAVEDGSILALSDREICFVLIEFNLAIEVELKSALSSVIELAASHSAIIDAFVSHLLVVTFGMIDNSPLVAHKSFIDAVLSKHGKDVKLVYSSGMGKIGNIGSTRRMSYTFVHPMFPKALKELSSISSGEAREIF